MSAELSRRQFLQLAAAGALPSAENGKPTEAEVQLQGLEHNILATMYDSHFVGLAPRHEAAVMRPATATLADAQAACGTDPAPTAISLRFPKDGSQVAVVCDFTEPYNKDAQRVDFIGPIALRHYYFPGGMNAQVGNHDTGAQALVDAHANWTLVLPKTSIGRVMVEPHPQASNTEVLAAHTMSPALLYRGTEKPAATMRDFFQSYSRDYLDAAQKKGTHITGTVMQIQVLTEGDAGWTSQTIPVDLNTPGSFDALMPAIVPAIQAYKPKS